VTAVQQTSERPRRLLGVVVLLVLGALTALSVLSLQPPAPVAADAPQQDFSAERAFVHVERLATETHVAGSEAGDRVVDYLEQTLSDLLGWWRERVAEETGVSP